MNFRERRHCATGDHIEAAGNSFDLCALNRRRQTQRGDSFSQKFRTQAARLEQRNGPFHQAGDYNPGQAGTRADIEPRRANERLEAHQLRRIQNVPLPDVLETGSRDQVLARGFAFQVVRHRL